MGHILPDGLAINELARVPSLQPLAAVLESILPTATRPCDSHTRVVHDPFSHSDHSPGIHNIMQGLSIIPKGCQPLAGG